MSERSWDSELDRLDTPAMLVDLPAADRNIERMLGRFRGTPVRVRPHLETVKSPEFARRMLDAGAAGVCVTKLGEAEVMAAAGIDDILITTELAGAPKLDRLVRLLRRHPRVRLVVDSVEGAEALQQALGAAGLGAEVLLDLFELALSILTTVISRPRAGEAVVDAGLESLSTDSGFAEPKHRPGMSYRPAGDEHGILAWAPAATGALPEPRVGDRIELWPSHIDTTVNLHDVYHVTSGGRLVAVWPVSARGKVQ